jgi:hypothetical protein
MTGDIIDIMTTEPGTSSTMDPSTLVRGSSRLLAEVGLEGELSTSKRLLGRSEQLAEKARAAEVPYRSAGHASGSSSDGRFRWRIVRSPKSRRSERRSKPRTSCAALASDGSKTPVIHL